MNPNFIKRVEVDFICSQCGKVGTSNTITNVYAPAGWIDVEMCQRNSNSLVGWNSPCNRAHTCSDACAIAASQSWLTNGERQVRLTRLIAQLDSSSSDK